MTTLGGWMSGRGAAALVTPDVMARAIGGYFLIGGVCGGAITLLMDADSPVQRIPYGVITGSSTIVGLFLIIWPSRISPRSHNVFAIIATAMVTTGITVVPDDRAAIVIASFYALMACDAAFFLPWRWAAINTLIAAICAVVALDQRPGLPWWTGLVPAGVVIAVALVISMLVHLAADADLDPLTGLTNRRGFDRALDTAIAGDAVPTIVLFDLDGFKEINDEFGHRAGDETLQSVAETWREFVTSSGSLARYGGDEFALVLPDVGEQEALALADRMREAIPLPATAGVTRWQPGESASFLVSRADVGLYRAKGSGGNRTVLESAHHVPLASELAEALQTDDVRVHYQPIVRLPDGKLVGYEALVRWTSELDQGISPMDVIRIAEEHGLIPALGQFVLRRACVDAAQLQAATPGLPIMLNVNVSGLELLEPDYVTSVAEILHETGWPAQQLVLEVTETALDVETPTTIAKLVALRATGIKIAIDDFGTGYSSLRRLVTLPSDLLKLDRTLVSSSIRDSTPQLLTVIARLSTRLGVPVIVEGVEDGYQADLLASMGYTLAQGYYYGRPEPLARYTQTSADAISTRGDSTS